MKLLPALVVLSLLIGGCLITWCSDPSSGQDVTLYADPTGGGNKVVETYDSGQKMTEGYLLDDETMVGRWTFWYANGRKGMEGVLENGKPVGHYTYGHMNGQKWREGGFNNGKEQGRWTTWHPNGRKWRDGELRNGREEGRWTIWNEDGSIDTEKSGIYEAGERVAPLPNK